MWIKVSKGAKIRNRYNQVPHLTKNTNGKVTNSQLDTTNESKEVSPFPADDHKAHINRRAQRLSKHNTKKHIKDPQKKTHRCFHPQWPRLLSVLRWWSCFKDSLFGVAPIVLGLCFKVYFLLSFLVCCWLLYFNYVVVWLSVFFVSSPLVPCVSMWSMLVAFLGHTHLFWALLYLVLLNEINRTEPNTFNIKWG